MITKPAPHELSRTAFIATFGGVYEHSPWVAEMLYDQGLSKNDGNPTKLAERMAAIVDAAGDERQMALLCAHPELAGKLESGMRIVILPRPDEVCHTSSEDLEETVIEWLRHTADPKPGGALFNCPNSPDH